MWKWNMYLLGVLAAVSCASEWVEVQCPVVHPFTFCTFAKGCGAGGWLVTFGPEGRLLGVITSTGPIKEAKIWDFQSNALLHTIPPPDPAMACFSLDFSPNGRLIAIGCVRIHGALSAVRLWDVNAGQRVHDFVIPIRVSPFVKFSPDGKWLAAAFYEDVKIFDVESGERIRVLSAPANTLAFSPDGKLLACAIFDRENQGFPIKLWRTDTWEEVLVLSGHADTIISLAFSPDAKLLATASLDGTIKLWDVAKGRDIHTLLGHNGGVLSVAFHPNGHFLASSAMDCTIRLWDVKGGQEILMIDLWSLFNLGEGFGTKQELEIARMVTRVHAVTFSPDGAFLVSSMEILRPDGCDEAVHVWRLPDF
ncbi:MAG: WD40 repeat domain-containing protein [Candidatus Bipolaricaulaceae bacterium]